MRRKIVGALAVAFLIVALAGCSNLLGGNDPESYSVSYNGNGSTGGSVPTDSGEYEEGDTVTVADNTGSLSRTSYTFAGWNSAADGSGTDYDAGSSLTMGSGDVTLYAKWSPALDKLSLVYRGKQETSPATYRTWITIHNDQFEAEAIYGDATGSDKANVNYIFIQLADGSAGTDVDAGSYTLGDDLDTVSYAENVRIDASGSGDFSGAGAVLYDSRSDFQTNNRDDLITAATLEVSKTGNEYILELSMTLQEGTTITKSITRAPDFTSDSTASQTIDSSDTMTIDGTEYEIENFLVGDFGLSSSSYLLELFFSTGTRSFEDDGDDGLAYPGDGSFVGLVLRSSTASAPAAGEYEAVMDDGTDAGLIVGGELQYSDISDFFGGAFQDGEGLNITVSGDTYTITGSLRYGRDTTGDDESDDFVSVTIDIEGALTGAAVDLSGINL